MNTTAEMHVGISIYVYNHHSPKPSYYAPCRTMIKMTAVPWSGTSVRLIVVSLSLDAERIDVQSGKYTLERNDNTVFVRTEAVLEDSLQIDEWH